MLFLFHSIMIKRHILILLGLLVGLVSAWGQTYSELKTQYPVSADGKNYVVSGFIPFNNQSDEAIFANTLLWTINNVCPEFRKGIEDLNVKSKSFHCDWVLNSSADSKQNNTYYCKVRFQVTEGKLIFYVSDILIESSVLMIKRQMPMEKLKPEKKESHKEVIDDFVQSESFTLNKLFDFVSTNQVSTISHWNDIALGRAVEGMNEDECLLAFGKPRSVQETNGEVQWMYSGSFYLFFRDGKVQTVIK